MANVVYLLNASIGLILLCYLMPDDFADIGYYGRAVAVCKLVMLIPIALAPLLYAQWSGLDGDERRLQVQLAFRLHLAMGIVIVSMFLLAGHWLVLFLYGKEFLPAVSALRILVIGIALRGILIVCISLLASDGRAHITACMMAVGVAAQIVLTWILVPHFGINGAALANTTGSFLVFLVGVFVLKHNYQVRLRSMIAFRKNDFRYLMNAIFKRSLK